MDNIHVCFPAILRKGDSFCVFDFAALVDEGRNLLLEELSFSFKTWPRDYKKISCSTQLSTEFFLLINVKMPSIFPANKC